LMSQHHAEPQHKATAIHTISNFGSRYLHFKRNGYEGHTNIGLI